MVYLARFRFFTILTCLLVVSGSAVALQLAARDSDEWIKRLETPERIQEQKIPEVIERLNLKPGMVIADIGAGSGIFSLPLAKAVGPTGKVYAVDIQQGLLDYIKKRAAEEKVGNVQTVLGGYDDPKIPSRDVDIGFFNDVLHHIEHRDKYLKALSKYIKPDGKIALIELNSASPKSAHHDEPALQVSRKQLNEWMAAAGFHEIKEIKDLFPDSKLFIIYGRK